MIGTGKSQAVEASVNSDYEVLLSPGAMELFFLNGSGTSPNVSSIVVGGIGPFTYSWVITGDDISIISPLSDNTKFSAGGFYVEYNEVATITVTDAGNGNAETERNINISFEFSNLN